MNSISYKQLCDAVESFDPAYGIKGDLVGQPGVVVYPSNGRKTFLSSTGIVSLYMPSVLDANGRSSQLRGKVSSQIVRAVIDAATKLYGAGQFDPSQLFLDCDWRQSGYGQWQIAEGEIDVYSIVDVMKTTTREACIVESGSFVVQEMEVLSIAYQGKKVSRLNHGDQSGRIRLPGIDVPAGDFISQALSVYGQITQGIKNPKGGRDIIPAVNQSKDKIFMSADVSVLSAQCFARTATAVVNGMSIATAPTIQQIFQSRNQGGLPPVF